jgi:predicted nucleic acid-binding protein
MIVVDTNVIAYLYLSSAHTAAAERTLLKDPAWAAPLLWRSELRNILALYVRQRLLAAVDAVRILGEAEDLMAGQEYAVRSRAVLELSIANGCSAYDGEFVLLAQDLGVALVTADKKLVIRFPATAVALSRFAHG